MKTILRSLLFAAVLVGSLSACQSSRLDAAQKSALFQARRQQVQQAIANMDFKIEMNQMTPQRGNTRTITPDYYVMVKGDVIESYLPFIGEAYRSYLGEDEPTHEDRISSCEVARNDKKGYTMLVIRFRRTQDQYIYRLAIGDDGRATLMVTCSSRSNISYEGEIIAPL